MTDHQRGDTLPPFSKAFTPNAERLFNRGVAFTNAFCSAPHCAPSRASFFSGLYPSMHGVWNNVMVSNALSRGLFDNVRLFSEDLRDAGYQMYYSGKWHVSDIEGPEKRGFENLYHPWNYRENVNLPDTHDWAIYKSRPVDKAGDIRGNGEIIRPGYTRFKLYGTDENPFSDNDTVGQAVDKLRELNTGTPFCMFVGTQGPHDPYIPPQKFLDMYDIDDIKLPDSFYDKMDDKPALYRRTRDRFDQLTEREHKEALRRYLAFCTYEDYLFGQLLDVVEQRGLWDDTIILYLSDHGDYAGAHGLWAKGLPCFREAYNICAIAGGGGIRHSGRVENSLVSIADFAPTILELSGIKTGREFTGMSLAPFFKHENPPIWRTELFTQTNGNEIYGIQRAVFNGHCKLVYNTFDYDEFYDTERDPHETVNEISNPEYAEKIRELYKKLWQFAYDNDDACVVDYIMTAPAQFGPGCIM